MENEILRRSFEEVQEKMLQQSFEIDLLTARIKELEPDATRYRKIQEIRKAHIGIPCACEFADDDGTLLRMCMTHANIIRPLEERIKELEAEKCQFIEFYAQQVEEWAQIVEDVEVENKNLNDWIDDLQSGMFINCVYCGHRYGPDDGNHLVTMRRALEKHIESCPKHPLSRCKAENERLREALQRLCDNPFLDPEANAHFVEQVLEGDRK